MDLSDKSIFETAKEFAYEYMDGINNRAVYPGDGDIEKLRSFYEPLPKAGSKENDILALLHQNGAPNTVAQTGSRYYGFVNGGALPVALAVKWMTDVWDQNAVLYVASPVAAVIEDVCEKWITDIFGLPPQTTMGLVGGSSDASLCALTAARNAILEGMGWDIYNDGLMGAPAIKVVLSDEAHASIFKVLSVLGIGTRNIIRVPSNPDGTLCLDQMPVPDERTLLILQAGNVNTGAFDNFEAICELAKAKNAWVHIDGAFGLWAQTSKSHSYLTKGIEKADSWSVDAHKTLNVPYDCGIVLCKSREALCKALQANGKYILYSDKRDPMLYTTAMSRRGRAFELWAAIKYLGSEGIGQLVESLCYHARYFANQLTERGFRIINEVVFNQILVACQDENETLGVLRLIQKDGICWCGETTWKGEKMIRVSICSWATTEKDIDLSVGSFTKNLKAYRRLGG